MTQSFDEWLDSTKLRGYVDENSLEASFEAGAQSRQAEIDELQISNHHLAVQLKDAGDFYDYEKKRADELRQRIDYALTFSATWHKSSGSALALEVIKILKGKEND